MNVFSIIPKKDLIAVLIADFLCLSSICLFLFFPVVMYVFLVLFLVVGAVAGFFLYKNWNKEDSEDVSDIFRGLNDSEK